MDMDENSTLTGVLSSNGQIHIHEHMNDVNGSQNEQYLMATISPPPYTSSQVIPDIAFEIPTKSYSLSSGFPYHDELVKFGISPQQWFEFSNEIIRVAQLSKSKQYSAIAAGVGVGVLSSTIIGPLGTGPGYVAGKAMHAKSLREEVEVSLRDGELKAILRFWNETKFKEQGLYVDLILPSRKSIEERKQTGADNNGEDELENKSVSFKQKSQWHLRHIKVWKNSKMDPAKGDQKEIRNRYKLVIKAQTGRDLLSSPTETNQTQCSIESPISELAGESPVSEMPGDSLDTKPAAILQ